MTVTYVHINVCPHRSTCTPKDKIINVPQLRSASNLFEPKGWNRELNHCLVEVVRSSPLCFSSSVDRIWLSDLLKKKKKKTVSRNVMKTLLLGEIVCIARLFFSRTLCTLDRSFDLMRALFIDTCDPAIASKDIQFWLVALSRLRAPAIFGISWRRKDERVTRPRRKQENNRVSILRGTTIVPETSPFSNVSARVATRRNLLRYGAGIIHPTVSIRKSGRGSGWRY